MSLATRCPACGTVFRVVRDQLKVSEGWVRCGRCSEVFNAGERLFDLEADAQLSAGTTTPASAAEAVQAATAPSAVADDALPTPAQASSEAAGEAAAAATAMARADDGLHARPEVDAARAHAAPEDVGPPPADLDLRADPAALLAVPTPGFVLRAERAERWQRPLWRGTMAALSLLLAAALAGQMALHYRDGLAAGWPAARPWLQAACGWLGCSIEPPRRIESLGVESSGLVRVEGTEFYRLSLVVRNRSSTLVRVPAIDLALTDAQGRTTVRRVLSAAELGQRGDSLPAQGEASLQAMLALGEQRVAGYTVELFYP